MRTWVRARLVVALALAAPSTHAAPDAGLAPPRTPAPAPAPAPTRTAQHAPAPVAPSPPHAAAPADPAPHAPASAAPSAAPPGPAAKPAPRPAPKPAAKPPAKPATKPGSGASGKARPRGPSEAARRAIAGAPTEAETARGTETPELAALREAEKELFGPASPGPSAPWPADEPFPMPVDPDRPVVHASGAPPRAVPSAPPSAEDARDLSWLRELAPAELPVRWDPRVVRYLEFYRDDPRGRALAGAWMRKAGKWGPTVRRILRAESVPDDLLWVALVESGFEPTARSPAGAAGLWQLMPDGARVYGLIVDRWMDERLDPERATEAAARYLSDLHRRFGGWELALAAYNMGYGGLLAAIRKFNTNDYWELSRWEAGLPWETTLYVPKIVALAVVAHNPAAFGWEGAEPEVGATADTIDVAPEVPLRAVADAAGAPLDVIEALNPQLRAGRTPPAPDGAPRGTRWKVHVPVGSGAKVARALASVRPEPTAAHVVRQGETLERVAATYGVSRGRLVELNALRADELVRPGTVLRVPAVEPRAVASAERQVVVVPAVTFRYEGRRRVFYRVQTGDTLSEIAAALGVDVDDVRRWNALDPAARLHDGMTLQVFVPERADLAHVVHLEEQEARVLAVGSDEFYAWFEAQKGRRREVVQVKAGDTWESIGRRYGLSLGQLERINRRPRTDKLSPGESVTVYASTPVKPASPLAKTADEPVTLPAIAAPEPEEPKADDADEPRVAP